jgi:hypothetical protein
MYAQEEHGKQHWDHLEVNHLLVSDGMMMSDHDFSPPRRRSLHMHVQPHVLHHQAAREGNLAPEAQAATTMTTDNPIMSGTPEAGHTTRRLPLWLGVVQHPLEAR